MNSKCTLPDLNANFEVTRCKMIGFFHYLAHCRWYFLIWKVATYFFRLRICNRPFEVSVTSLTSSIRTVASVCIVTIELRLLSERLLEWILEKEWIFKRISSRNWFMLEWVGWGAQNDHPWDGFLQDTGRSLKWKSWTNISLSSKATVPSSSAE